MGTVGSRKGNGPPPICKNYRLEIDVASIAENFDDLHIRVDMPEGVPNVPAREDIRITDM